MKIAFSFILEFLINNFITINITILAAITGYLFGFYQRKKHENRGESKVRCMLIKTFGSNEYHLFNNVTLPFKDGTTQIDHILVSRNGIFVIEVKHYSGWIFGDSKSPKWTQVIYRVKNRFQNPLYQNAKHLHAIRDLLDFLPSENIHSIVVFTGSAEFKTPMPDNVLYIEQLVRYIRSFGTAVMSANRMEFCVGRIETQRRLISGQTDIEHENYLNRKFGEIN
ncbi:MAG: NERD domain-containing protein [Spirochaetales bacterium]|nr:NERD domain-containing protein [Spirochaetales bacterium]